MSKSFSRPLPAAHSNPKFWQSRFVQAMVFATTVGAPAPASHARIASNTHQQQEVGFDMWVEATVSPSSQMRSFVQLVFFSHPLYRKKKDRFILRETSFHFPKKAVETLKKFSGSSRREAKPHKASLNKETTQSYLRYESEEPSPPHIFSPNETHPNKFLFRWNILPPCLKKV